MLIKFLFTHVKKNKMTTIIRTLIFSITLLFVLFYDVNLIAQVGYKLLHYTETSGFDHQTRASSLALFQRFPNLQITDDLDGSNFNTTTNLNQFNLIVFSNTSGNQLLDSLQRANFESYIQQGGSVIGIHAATDTYRHSTANGNKTGTWDFYAETIGGSVQENPNHVTGTPAYNINKLGSHPTTVNLPNPWNKNEEYYYWESGYLNPSYTTVLEVERTIGPNNQVNSYDSARAVSWIKELPSGSRIFYTSAGHANSSFLSDSLFERHISDAVDWCLARITSIQQLGQVDNYLKVYPNPSENRITIQLDQKLVTKAQLNLYNLNGQLMKNLESITFPLILDLSELDEGTYLLQVEIANETIERKIIKK